MSLRPRQDSGATFRDPCQKYRHVLLLALQISHGRLLRKQHPGFPQQSDHGAGPLLLQRERHPVQHGRHGKLNRPLEEEGCGCGEQEVEGVQTRGPHAVPPGGLPLYAGEILELTAHCILQSENVNCCFVCEF